MEGRPELTAGDCTTTSGPAPPTPTANVNVKVSRSPSGSRNAPDTSTVAAPSSTPIVNGASVPHTNP